MTESNEQKPTRIVSSKRPVRIIRHFTHLPKPIDISKLEGFKE